MCNYPVSRRNHFLRSGKIYFPLILLVCSVFIILSAFAGPARAQADRKGFFSYKRFLLNQDVADKMAGNGKAQRELKRFSDSFMEGIYALSSGRLQEAKKDLHTAQESWPEYFGTDFLLARIYEDEGDYRTAARYYKSYLNKLRDFHAGRYRISASLIRSLMPYDIERYDTAYSLVKTRLERYDIDLDRVRPVFVFPAFLFHILLGAVIAGVYILVFYRVRPYLKKRRRIKNPPEGFWVCRNCGFDNPDLARECGECGRPRE